MGLGPTAVPRVGLLRDDIEDVLATTVEEDDDAPGVGCNGALNVGATPGAAAGTTDLDPKILIGATGGGNELARGTDG